MSEMPICSMQQAQLESQRSKKHTSLEPKRCPKVSGVCLDYLNGQCHAKRYQCKFYHPSLAEYPKFFSDENMSTCVEICEVYALTKRCKFGDHCMKLHVAQPKFRPPGPPHFQQANRAKAAKKRKLKEKEMKEQHNQKQQSSSTFDSSEPLDFEGMVASILQPLEGMDDDGTSLSQSSSESSITSSCLARLNNEPQMGLLPSLLPSQCLDQVLLDIMGDLNLRDR